MFYWKRGLAALLFLGLLGSAQALTVSDEDAQEAGQRIWKNECSGTVEGLTSWNSGEDFASLGIGHFIWYPEGRRGPFEESFPKLVASLQSQGVAVPAWLSEARACPWNSRQAFLADFQGPRLTALRKLLASTVPQQARFIATRLEATLPKMLESIPEGQQAEIRRRFEEVAAAPGGIYALVDYVNFKGEGVKPSERYNGQGWVLLQVLQEMSPDAKGRKALQSFSAAAEKILIRRVNNSPPARGESRWLQGWTNRVRAYGH